jgi:hypothetical protein
MPNDDFQRFANPRFLRTVDAGLLKEFFLRHEIPPGQLDLSLLDTAPDAGRAAITHYLLHTPKHECAESLTWDLHRIEGLGRPVGQDALLQEARRLAIELVPAEAQAKLSPRNLALLAFIEFPAIFEAAENTLTFLQPQSVEEFVAPEEGIVADMDAEHIAALLARAREIFRADLRGEFCEAHTYEDGSEIHVSIRHGAVLTVAEVIEGNRKRIRSFQEIDNAVLAYSANEGRLKIWGCSKSNRLALARAFSDVILDNPDLFNAPAARRLYTLERVEQAGGGFVFRHGHDDGIAKVLIYEAQVNRMMAGRRGAQRVALSLIARDPFGAALKALHSSRDDIVYGDGGWRLAHLVLKIELKSDKPRPPTIAVKIKPDSTLSFPRQRHQRRVMDLLRMNGMLCEREPASLAVAAG